jgi:hypothetical protein
MYNITRSLKLDHTVCNLVDEHNNIGPCYKTALYCLQKTMQCSRVTVYSLQHRQKENDYFLASTLLVSCNKKEQSALKMVLWLIQILAGSHTRKALFINIYNFKTLGGYNKCSQSCLCRYRYKHIIWVAHIIKGMYMSSKCSFTKIYISNSHIGIVFNSQTVQ